MCRVTNNIRKETGWGSPGPHSLRQGVAPSSSCCEVSLGKGPAAPVPRTGRESAVWHPPNGVPGAGGWDGWDGQCPGVAWLGLQNPLRHACRSASFSASWESAFLLAHPPCTFQGPPPSTFPGCGEDTAPWPEVASSCTCRQDRPEPSLHPERCAGWPYTSCSGGPQIPLRSLYNPHHRELLETKPCLDKLS